MSSGEAFSYTSQIVPPRSLGLLGEGAARRRAGGGEGEEGGKKTELGWPRAARRQGGERRRQGPRLGCAVGGSVVSFSMLPD